VGGASGRAGSGASGRGSSGGGAPARAGSGGGLTGPGAAGDSAALTGIDLIARTLGGEVIDEIGDA
jgi:hypothetical protein